MNDPILDEVHDAREKIWKSCGGDWAKLFEYLQAREAQHPERLVGYEQFKERKASQPIQQDRGQR
jgi:hypothetical protein